MDGDRVQRGTIEVTAAARSSLAELDERPPQSRALERLAVAPAAPGGRTPVIRRSPDEKLNGDKRDGDY